MQSDGAVCNPPTTQRRTVETTKARAKRAKQQLFFGSPLICRMVQGYRVSYCKNLNKSEGRETILTEEHDCGMPVLLQPPSPLLNVKNSQGKGKWAGQELQSSWRGETVLLTSSMRRSSCSPFSHRLRCTQLSTLEYSLPLLGRVRLSSSMTSN